MPSLRAILNVAASSISPRTGGVATQLTSRLHVERTLRSVALLSPGLLELSTPVHHIRSIASFRVTSEFVASDFEAAVREALAITGARAIHLEGTSGVPVGSVLRLVESGIQVVLSVHDFSLFCTRPHLLEQPMNRFCGYSFDMERCHRCLRQTWDVQENVQAERRALGRQLLASATGLIFPSPFLLEQHRRLFSLPDLEGAVVEPGVQPAILGSRRRGTRPAIAYAGSAKRHKGTHLLPEIVRQISSTRSDVDWHVFGGGDEDLLCDLRRLPNLTIHGYYRAGELPSLLVRHGIALLVLPSIVPESHSLVLSEAWLAGVTVAAFDIGAVAERIGRDSRLLAPLETGAAGLAAIIERWLSGEMGSDVSHTVKTSADAARAHVELYRQWGF